jgi:hypothetical protein
MLEGLCKEIKFLLHQKASSANGKIDANHGTLHNDKQSFRQNVALPVGAMRSAKRVIHVNVAQLGQRLTERVDIRLVSLDLYAIDKHKTLKIRALLPCSSLTEPYVSMSTCDTTARTPLRQYGNASFPTKTLVQESVAHTQLPPPHQRSP